MTEPDVLRQIDQAAKQGKISEEARSHLRRWAEGQEYGEYHAVIGELVRSGLWQELSDAFGGLIPFGTGGRRGPMGVGPNRINDRTIGESAQGLASHLLGSLHGRTSEGPPAVVIAHDTRNGSRRFAQQAASVLAGNGVRALVFEGARSTPELSFAVRKLEADAGVVISASHNPPSDNGFKAYWTDGGQVVPPNDEAIIEEVGRVKELRRMPEERARAAGLWRDVGPEVDAAYVDYVAGLCLSEAREIGAVFSPLHGTGTTSVWRCLLKAGFEGVHPTVQQWEADGEFRGVPGGIANPEVPAALEASQALAREVGADLVLASDPDADRLGAAVLARGEWTFLTGNQIGILLLDHVLERLKERRSVPEGGIVYKTLVTSDLIDRICAAHGVRVRGDLLVGFKYIAEAIEQLPDPRLFVFGTEESHGYLRGPEVRDKDASQAAVLLCERAALARAGGRTLLDDLDVIYGRYGVFREVTKGMTFAAGKGGGRGIDTMRRLMDSLRSAPPRQLGPEKVFTVADRAEGTVRDAQSGRVVGEVGGTRGNVLVFTLSEDGSDRVSIRPSGTEPKIKLYVQVHSEPGGDTAVARRRADGRAGILLQAMDALAGERTRL